MRLLISKSVCNTGGVQTMSFFDRAYINLPKTFDEQEQFLSNLNLEDLIMAVAIANPSGDGDSQLYNRDTHEFYSGRTKSYIVQKTKKYILGMPEHFSPEENMATFVSLRQLKKLIKSFYNDKKRISCYGLIYVYVIYTLLKGKSSKADDCLKYLEALYTLVSNYFEHNPDDQLAAFFLGCYKLIYQAIKNGNTTLHNNQLPPIPRNQPKDDE